MAFFGVKRATIFLNQPVANNSFNFAVMEDELAMFPFTIRVLLFHYGATIIGVLCNSRLVAFANDVTRGKADAERCNYAKNNFYHKKI